jgi:hypothetical protein
MKQQIGRQLVLDLMRQQRFRPLAEKPDGLLEALADLLLEALGPTAPDPGPQTTVAEEQASTKETSDEPEDHH